MSISKAITTVDRAMEAGPLGWLFLIALLALLFWVISALEDS